MLTEFKHRDKAILETYGKENLADKPAFQGGYINYGYWKDINLNNTISVQDRILASKKLYEYLISFLDISKPDKILEVGCGAGNNVAYIAEKFQPSYILGVDISDEQIKRAKIKFQSISNVNFKVSTDSNIRASNESFNKILSLEAAQYFPCIKSFAKEMYRLLSQGGKLAISTFLSVNEEGYKKAKGLLPTVKLDIDLIIPINKFRDHFLNIGFNELYFEEIGSEVFEGFDKWLSQVEDVAWGRNFYKLYLSQRINYYVLVFSK